MPTKFNPNREKLMASMELSLVRSNMLTRQDYTPYCGASVCKHIWPLTRFNGHQFECECGWKSGLESDFIELYKQAQEGLKTHGGN